MKPKLGAVKMLFPLEFGTFLRTSPKINICFLFNAEV